MALTVQERLIEAEVALHALLTGQAVAEVRDSNGETVRYTIANASRLRAYIEELRRQIAPTLGGPLRPIFR